MDFFSYMATAFGQVATLAILVLVGFFCDKAKIYTETVSRQCNDLLFYIITPAVIIDSFLRVSFTREKGMALLAAAGIALIFHLLGALAIRPLFAKSGEDRPVFQYATMYGNLGYMGLPLAGAVAGELGVFYCSAAVVVFNIFAFTHGVTLMEKEEKKIQLKKLLVNPGSLGILIGLPLFLLHVKLPAMLGAPIAYIGNLNTPLAMLMFGTYLAHTDLIGMFRRGENYLVAFLKLLALPLVMIGGLYLVGVRGELLVTAAVFCSAPTANNTVMFAAKYGRDTGTASKVGGFTAVLSILTMPLCIALADFLG